MHYIKIKPVMAFQVPENLEDYSQDMHSFLQGAVPNEPIDFKEDGIKIGKDTRGFSRLSAYAGDWLVYENNELKIVSDFMFKNIYIKEDDAKVDKT